MSVRTEEVQQQTLSLRISDHLRSRIEGIRGMLSATRGTPVSISDAAKTLLESEASKSEKFQILSEPTASMARILDKGNRGRYIAQAEWYLLAHFIQSGLTWPNVSFEYHDDRSASAAALVRAFQAVYLFRLRASGPRPDKDAYYLQQLDCLHDWSEGDLLGFRELPPQDQISQPAAIEMACEKLLEYFEKPTGDIGGVADMVARCLAVILDQETHNEVLLDQVLRPHWNVLWRLAARGHYCRLKVPVRAFNPTPAGRIRVVGEIFTAEAFSLFLMFHKGPLELQLEYSPEDGTHFSFPVREYPALLELRSIVAQLPDIPKYRDGNHIVASHAEGYPGHYWINDKASGFGFRVGPEEIARLRCLFDDAWSNDSIRSVLDEMALVYGEF